ncbi:MAG TPA: periplasmic heavy metal sensor [Bacteroidota bacterium]|nr:periplasmic heavy metal sensor [Bacteroidota bacterium]
MKQILAAMLIASITVIANAQERSSEPPANKPREHMRMERDNPMARMKLTDDQKNQLKDIRYHTDKKAIELRSQLALSRLELSRLLSSDSPDQEAIEKKINEVSANESALHVNKLNGWFEANKILTPEQQKEWRKVLRTEAMAHMRTRRFAGRHPHMEGTSPRDRS